MNQVLPDWMFAACAIGVYELCNLIATHFHTPRVRWLGVALALLSLAVVGVRYLIRYLRRDKNPAPPDPDEWKHY
ncbi:hypothetical protein JI721_14895 [Alicyclobacillus cycloheptanicus]|uniref:Uncharacterized protein n=1 Tax=Alicyclobacillus cycloheptanicus TaxID=1457 RepID=A0ABT9XEH8_9BACL|nr:hypothetical protein [Alicyclobacillus cycloheptanicus]MDQ0188223.1 hypothetical protein [Alicyclobacillus cycloheptanicus]WDM00952.1 hypothetical protein JI721_14895 [Alicyclobacillus cycloheptanicus]